VTNGPAADRIDQLRDRWRAEPFSRGFLQIAEEYRREGRLGDALAMLDEGLRQQPGYLSALVAKGRCLLELGQAAVAREALERVVRQDPTQAVATKLLVRAYVENGEARQARERLDLYGLLHGGDPEIRELGERIAALERGAARPPVPEVGDVFNLPAVAVPPPALALPGEEPAEPEPPVAFTAAWAQPPAEQPGRGLSLEPASPSNGDGEPFAGLATADARRRYLAALVAEGIFSFEPAPAPAEEPAPPRAPVFEAEERSATVAEVLAESAERFPAAQPLPEPEPAAEPATVGPAATVTLGQVYLEQGHTEEAERIFHEVLRREPDSRGAREALEDLGRRQSAAAPAAAAGPGTGAAPAAGGRLDAAGLLASFHPDAAHGDTPAARKAYLLTRYLERLRRGGEPRVP
jgi:tetratricopeptide (TPR) repeat protein